MIFENEKSKAVYISALNKMTPYQKLKKACDLSDFTKMLFINGLKKRYPDLNDDEFNKLLLKRLKECSNSNF